MPTNQTFYDPATGLGSRPGSMHAGHQDVAESAVQTVDRTVSEKVGMSPLHMLTVGSIAASVVLYLMGRKTDAIFIGLWPPTLQALKAVSGISEHRTGRW